MKNLIIIGARGFGREVYHLARQCDGYQRDYRIKGFLDDKADALNGLDGYPPIIGSVELHEPKDDDVFVCALGDPKYKKLYAEMIKKKNGQFLSLIHPTANTNSPVGEGAIILANVFVSCDVTIDQFVTIQPFAAIGHDARIGAFSHLNAYSFMGGYACLGEGTTLHTGAKVLPHKTVGAWATVGVASVVLRNVKTEQTVFGIPAMPI